jgi:hypothetical protein
MSEKSLRNLVGTVLLVTGLLMGTAMLLAAHLVTVNAQTADSGFTTQSGAEFAQDSLKFDVPYEPTPMVVVDAMLRMASVGPNDFLIDLGSGDGRIVITAAKKYGARGFGVDLNEKLVGLSRQYAKEMGVAERTAFHVQDLFLTNISKADVVTMYLLQEINLQVRPKLLSELRPGTRVVSHDYHMGEWRPEKIAIIDSNRPAYGDSMVYFWIVPAKVAGRWQWSLSMPGDDQTFVLELDQDFQDIRAVVLNGTGRWRLFNTTLRGDRISFSAVSEANDRMIRQDYEGRVKGNAIEGTVKLSGGTEESQLEWRASRLKTGG